MDVIKGKHKHSRQRDSILELLKSTGDHPTAAWLYEKLKGEFSNLSMGTVYRNLNILVEQGLARKIDFGSTFDRFDANIDPHYHFICEGCHGIFDLDIPVDEILNRKVEKESSFHLRIKEHQIQFYGICAACSGK